MKFTKILVASTLLMACGGHSQPPATPAAPAPTAPAESSAPVGTDAAWALPAGPRAAGRQLVAVAVQLDPGKIASMKPKGVPAPPASCNAATAKADADLVAIAASAPPECTDAVVDPSLRARKAGPMDDDGQRLVAYSLAGRLARTSQNAPTMKDASDKAKVKAFIQGPLRTWMVEQATAIDTLSAPAVHLEPGGRSIVAVEAGMADLRLVDTIRSAPTPSTWDNELKQVYEIALDEALEPRKTRGRDAALVGLADYATLGVVGDARVARARALLSKLYGGRRIDALDRLIVAKGNVFLERGFLYWRRVDFVEAAYAAADKKDDDSRLQLAIALALAKGPNGAREMMTAPLRVDHTEALDELAASGGPNAGAAAFDAAYLHSLSVPDDATASAYLADVAARARKASALLTDPEQKKRAEQLATDSDAAAKATK